METAKKLLQGALIVGDALAMAFALSLVACVAGNDSSGMVQYDPSVDLDEDDPCVEVYQRLMTATEGGGDVATLNALAAELEECSGPGQVGVVMGPSGLAAVGFSLLYMVVPIVVAVVIGNAIYDALRSIIRRRND